ncbi:hypothetical protein [Streptomyces sp. S186]|uniref:hypothetical protein n=1 Tax=Streptomyces sp. S186 TaxID=3434395 RepID=UPI003F677F10
MEQAHARITAMIAWLEDALGDLTTEDGCLIYEQIFFKDPYPESSSGDNGRHRERERTEQRRNIAESYKGDQGEQW